MVRALALVVAVLVAVLGSVPMLRAASENLVFDQGGEEVWHLEADQVTYDARRRFYTATGRVRLNSGDRSISADEIRLDALTKRAILEGHVRLERAGDWLEGDRANVDLDQEAGTIEQGRGFLAKNHFYFGGPKVEQVASQVYHVESGTFTTCDGEAPSWQFRASDLKVTATASPKTPGSTPAPFLCSTRRTLCSRPRRSGSRASCRHGWASPTASAGTWTSPFTG